MNINIVQLCQRNNDYCSVEQKLKDANMEEEPHLI